VIMSQIVGSIKIQETYVGQQRAKRLFVGFVAHEAQRALGAAVIGIAEGDDFRAARFVAFCQLHRSFYGFAARITKYTLSSVSGSREHRNCA